MASTRLTNTARDQIWERLERHAFQERRDALQRQFESLANEAYLRFIGSQEGFTKATFIGHGWVGKRKSFLMKLGDRCRGLELVEAKVFPSENISCYSQPTIGVCGHQDPMTLQWTELDDRKRALEGEVLRAKHEARTALNKATTFAQLKAAWPELLPLCEDLLREVAAPKQELVVAGSLNKNLGLPAEKK